MERNLNAAADLFLYCDIEPNKDDFESVKYFIEQRITDYESCLGHCHSIKVCGEPMYYSTTEIESSIVSIVALLKNQLFKLKAKEINGLSKKTSTRTQRTPPRI
jgi:hypothetical protein